MPGCLFYAERMFKWTFIKGIAQKNRKPQKSQQLYNEVLNDLLAHIQQQLAAGREVRFPGFGVFYTRIRKPSKGLHFKTKKPIQVPAIRIPAFRAGALLKRAVRKKK